MTFSVVGRHGTAYGVAVASKFLAAGSIVPGAWAGAGAIATQAWANVAYRADGVALLARGRSAQETLDELVAADPNAASRQAGIVGPDGAATFTGPDCLDWAGGRAAGDVAVQGNILTGPEVVEAMAEAWHAHRGERLPERLVLVLAAGDAAGGDRRGRQSAALIVAAPGAGYGGHDIEVDLRVDDHPDPVTELARLLRLHRLYFDAAEESTLIPLEGEVAAEVAALLDRAGHRGESVDAALASWAAVENFEERMHAGRIEPAILDRLREVTR